MKGRPAPLNLNGSEPPGRSKFSLTESGTFTQGDITIGK